MVLRFAPRNATRTVLRRLLFDNVGCIAMADLVQDPRLVDQELPAHLRTFHSFSKLVLFAIMYIGLVLACLALAFLGHAPLIAALIGIGATVTLLTLFAVTN